MTFKWGSVDFTTGASTIFEDNQAAIAVAQNSMAHGRTKHYDLAQLFVHDRIASGKVSLTYISTNENVDDILTKPLLETKFEYFRNRVGVVSASSLLSRNWRSVV